MCNPKCDERYIMFFIFYNKLVCNLQQVFVALLIWVVRNTAAMVTVLAYVSVNDTTLL